jgi:glycerate 2-kinase
MSEVERTARSILQAMFRAAVRAADPSLVLAKHLPEPPNKGRVVVVGAGKSAAAMARAVEVAWPMVDLSGVVVTRDGHAVDCDRINVLEASHPIPDDRSLKAAERILAAVSGLGSDDLVLALISGGGSALMSMPAPGITPADKALVNRLLLASGFTITEMNRVRRRLSAIKGGRLALAAAPARLVTIAISDVPGDDVQSIASGPTVHDPNAGCDLSALVARLGPELPDAALKLLMSTPQPLPSFAADFRMIATPLMALEAAAQVARDYGITPLILGDALEGEASSIGVLMAGIARSASLNGLPAKSPVVLLSGGETTVTIGSQKVGRGGRNTEFLLALALGLDGFPGVDAISGDTDGIDGSEDAAGAIVTPDTLARARTAGLDPTAVLAGHDSYTLFASLDDLVITGPTLTNVNDFRAVLIQ